MCANMSEISGRLTAERKRVQLRQIEMADLCGVGRATQVRYESGQSSPPADYLLKAATLGIDIAYVLTGKREAELSPLTPEETALLDNYRNASAEGQAAARAVLNAVEKRPPRKKAGGE